MKIIVSGLLTFLFAFNCFSQHKKGVCPNTVINYNSDTVKVSNPNFQLTIHNDSVELELLEGELYKTFRVNCINTSKFFMGIPLNEFSSGNLKERKVGHKYISYKIIDYHRNFDRMVIIPPNDSASVKFNLYNFEYYHLYLEIPFNFKAKKNKEYPKNEEGLREVIYDDYKTKILYVLDIYPLFNEDKSIPVKINFKVIPNYE